MSNVSIGIDDKVNLEGEDGVWQIVGTRSEEPCFEVQLNRDAATKRYIRTEKLTLVAKAEGPDELPGFVPSRGIM
jgi:hypothetical protein